MPEAGAPWIAELLDFWFGTLGPDDWFGGKREVDTALERRFGHVLKREGSRPVSDFMADRRTAQAAILLFDQVPRNIHRDTPKAFAYDSRALELCKAFIVCGWDAWLPDEERQFIAMPMMHSESLTDQIASLAYFRRHLPGNVSFAESHHAMIQRFGRFPHRNETLGRTTTEAERQAIEDGFSW